MQLQKTDGQEPPVQEGPYPPVPPGSKPLITPPGEAEEAAASPHLTPEEADAIFVVAVSEIPTQPLTGPSSQEQQAAARYVLLVTLLLFCSLLGGAVLGIVTYPTVTIDLVPVTKGVTITAQLALPTRTLAPVSVTKTLSQPTTGHGHQDATNATGSLTLYNGRFSPQTITRGSILTGSDGRQVVTDDTVTIPAASTQQVGVAEVSAHALRAGGQGNIPALAINLAISGDLIAKNLAAFSGGKNARDYRAVSQADIATLTAHLRQQLTRSIPQAFAAAPGEMVTPTHCTLTASADHAPGQEAAEVTGKARYTCKGIAYDTNQLQQSATSAFTATTRPGTGYELVGSVQTRVTAASPVVTASIRGLWVYRLSEEYQQFLAEQLAGDSQAQARAYLLATGFITRATVPAGQLPKDPGHIHFETLIGL